MILIGNTGKDPEYKTLQDGTPVAKLTIATTESYRLKSGETQTKTEWHSVDSVAWPCYVSQPIHTQRQPAVYRRQIA